ncbi:nucleotidyltransferase domain-containing protein [Frondihabitans cladoniiphilus]|uniref:Polymerase beta nucleotidyltransferase domain-containing protein n=1 Tax=Frondihabitans cladoniiphilus TaxID=715785 RepID=A0ABP8VUQ1_9MICO
MDLSHPIRSVMPQLDGEIFSVLARTTQPLTGRKIAGLVDRGSVAGVRRALGRLVQDGLVLSDQIGSALVYVANRQHLLWPAVETMLDATQRVPSELRARIAESAAAFGQEEQSVLTVALYGSVARGDSSAQSDIDLVIVATGESVEVAERFADIVAVDVRRWTGNDCNAYCVDEARLQEMTRDHDPIIESWASDAVTIAGPDFETRMSYTNMK